MKKFLSTLLAFTLITSLFTVSGCSLFGSSEDNSDNSTVAVHERKGVSREANEAMAAIDMIGTVTLDSEEQIVAAEALYEALSDSDKEDIDNYDVLVAARKAYNQLILQDFATDYLIQAKAAFLQPEAIVLNSAYALEKDGAYYFTYEITSTDLLGEEVTEYYGNTTAVTLDDDSLNAISECAALASLIGSTYWNVSDLAICGQELDVDAIIAAYMESF